MPEDANIPVPLTSLPDDMLASAVVAALQNGGVEAVATGGFTAGFRAEAPGDVQIMVKQQDQERAQALLDAFQADQVDWSKVDVGKPEDDDQ